MPHKLKVNEKKKETLWNFSHAIKIATKKLHARQKKKWSKRTTGFVYKYYPVLIPCDYHCPSFLLKIKTKINKNNESSAMSGKLTNIVDCSNDENGDDSHINNLMTMWSPGGHRAQYNRCLMLHCTVHTIHPATQHTRYAPRDPIAILHRTENTFLFTGDLCICFW